MSHIFDSDEGMWKRNWKGDEYEQWVAKKAKNLTMQDIQDWSGTSFVALDALEAAGAFGSSESEGLPGAFTALRRPRY